MLEDSEHWKQMESCVEKSLRSLPTIPVSHLSRSRGKGGRTVIKAITTGGVMDISQKVD